MSKPLKWVAVSVGAIIGIAHIGVLGHLLKQPNVPILPLPKVSDTTSYKIKVTSDGYEIEYIGDDPKVLTEQIENDVSNGVFGIGGRRHVVTSREYTRGSSANQPGGSAEGKLDAKSVECIMAEGGGRSSGALVGGSVASGVLVPAVASIPYVGWLAAGWATLLGTEIGGDLGAGVASTYKGC